MMCDEECSGYILLGKMAVSKEQTCIVEYEASLNWGDKCRFLIMLATLIIQGYS